MPTHIPIKDNNSGTQKVDVRTKGDKIRETLLKRDPDHFKKAGSKGGKKSGNRPFKDSEKARAAVNKRWGKRDEKTNAWEASTPRAWDGRAEP